MRSIALFTSLLAALPALCVLPLVQGRPRALSKQERIANTLAQKPLHTTALLAGAAAMPTPSPYPPGSSDLGYTERPSQDDLDDHSNYSDALDNPSRIMISVITHERISFSSSDLELARDGTIGECTTVFAGSGSWE
ncbi:MAG: hypothetical protein LQ339_005223 [Xanthoria mediterranea]|nr:MAG: hypothetical protein LQ339_005223 [Xanthoria mediterranea]